MMNLASEDCPALSRWATPTTAHGAPFWAYSALYKPDPSSGPERQHTTHGEQSVPGTYRESLSNYPKKKGTLKKKKKNQHSIECDPENRESLIEIYVRLLITRC